MAQLLDSPAAVRRAAMDLLALREQGRVELERKLKRKGATPELIEPALDRLTEQGLLNETRYLESFIGSRARAGYGPLRISQELAQRGLNRNAITQAMAESEVDWQASLRLCWQRKFAERRPHDAKEQAKQARYLAQRGFALEAISRLLRGRTED